MVDLYTADQRANDFATGEPIGGLETLFHLSGEVFQPTNQQPQLALERLRVRQLHPMGVPRRSWRPSIRISTAAASAMLL
ncbi:MAG: hypothetical protein M3069_10010 [Chloroflexota bacterium]|nr:hypothetical protein [Chloroflexota bacterium]